MERSAVATAWALAVVAIALSVAAAVLAGTGSVAELPVKQVVTAALLAVPGALIAAGRPRMPIGWLLLGVALLFAGSGLAQWWVTAATELRVDVGVAWAIWYADRFAALLVVGMFLALVLLPDGKLPSPRWRPLVGTVVVLQVLTVVAWSLVRGPAAEPDAVWPAIFRTVRNPVGLLPPSVGDLLQGADFLVLSLPLLLCPVAFAVRLQRDHGDERRRLAMTLLAVSAFVVLVVVGRVAWPAGATLLDVVGGAVLAIGLVAAVLDHRLPDVQVVVHRAIVYGVLSLTIAMGYVVTVTVAARLGSALPAFAAGLVAAVVALAVLPLRDRLQLLVDRLLNGDRRRPDEALRRLADNVHDASTLDGVLSQVAASVATSLRVPWVRVQAQGRVVEQGTKPDGSRQASAALLSQGGSVGEISVATGPGRSLHPGDVRLLSELGRHGGISVHAVLLAEAVAASRQRLVVAREDERRRLRRELHDQLGPTLASVTMQLGAIRNVVSSDPVMAAEQLGRLERASRGALEDVRRVALELRPPVLDESGLMPALQRLAADLGLELDIAGGVALPELSAASEVAAYRIGAEALANIARHAGTNRATLSIVVSADAIRLETSDRGVGFDERAGMGVGVLSMRERAEELGGSLRLSSAPGRGTTVTALLPLATTERRDPARAVGKGLP